MLFTLAKLFGINIQTLYFYDRIGLFSPVDRNPNTNVRKYAFEQIYELSTILYLRKLGLSLDEIKDSLRTLTPETAKKKLTERSNELRKNWEEITKKIMPYIES
ncbi:MAG: MerR family transcriptional regulator [Spirochaetaceae bacterium]|nr:MerR family transcriptional regulator [Spirochaetaceae bacterium]